MRKQNLVKRWSELKYAMESSFPYLEKKKKILNLRYYSPTQNVCIERTQERLDALFLLLLDFRCLFSNVLKRSLKELIWKTVYGFADKDNL